MKKQIMHQLIAVSTRSGELWVEFFSFDLFTNSEGIMNSIINTEAIKRNFGGVWLEESVGDTI